MNIYAIINIRRIHRYFTLWGLQLCCIYTTLVMLYYLLQRLKPGWLSLTYIKITLVIFEITWTAEFIIDTVFWFILLPLLRKLGRDDFFWRSIWSFLFNTLLHFYPIVFLSCELAYCKYQIVGKHFAFCIILMILYALLDAS